MENPIQLFFNDLTNTMHDLLEYVAVECADEFDRNFEREAFFDTAWKKRQFNPDEGRGTLTKSGKLRRSIRYTVIGTATIEFHSNKPYAMIHNQGGNIEVTAKMKRFAWAQYYKAGGTADKNKHHERVHYNRKLKTAAVSVNINQARRFNNASKLQQRWKNIALMKVGDKIKIPKRQFIGEHDSLNVLIDSVVTKHIEALWNKYF